MKFKHLEAIVFDPKWEIDPRHPLKRNEVVFFLGESPNVLHAIVVTYEGQIITMVHTEDFRKATEDEV